MAVHKGVGHYGPPITLEQAKKVMAAAEGKAKQNSWNVAISIVDSGAHAVMLHRLDGTQLASIRIAEGKARTAVEFRRPTKALAQLSQLAACNGDFEAARGIKASRIKGARSQIVCSVDQVSFGLMWFGVS